MPRRFAYKPPPAAVATRAAEAGPTPARIAIEARQPGGVTVEVSLDAARYRTPVLARELGRAWVDRFADEAHPSVSTVRAHKSAVVDLLGYCGRVGAPTDFSCPALSGEFLDDWQDDVARRHPPGRSHLAGQHAGVVFKLLRRIAEVDRAAVAPGALERASKPAAHANDSYGEAWCEFTTSDLRRLIPAAISGVWATERRIEAGRVLLADGCDPRRSGDWNFANLVWLAAAGELTVRLARANLPDDWRCWDGSLRLRAPKRAGDNRQGKIGELVAATYGHVFPHPLDLVAHFVLIALDTAAWPEGVKDLTVHQARPLSGATGLELTKNRLPGSIEKRVRDAGTGVSASRRFRDTGTVLRSLLDVTEAARAKCGSDMVFVGGIVHNRWEGVKVGPVSWDGRTTAGSNLNQWIIANGLDRPAERTVRKASGDVAVVLPPISRPWHLQRLRKATISHYGEHHPEEMPTWQDNTLAVFQDHYVTGSVVLKTKIGKLARQAATDLTEMVSSHTGFTVVSPEAATELRAESRAVGVALRLDREKLHQLATGNLDVDGGIAACTDLLASPFVAPGELCRGAKLGLCLVCPNAVITPDHAVGLGRFDDEVIEEHRRSLDPAAFGRRWVPIRRALRWALAQLGAAEEQMP